MFNPCVWPTVGHPIPEVSLPLPLSGPVTKPEYCEHNNTALPTRVLVAHHYKRVVMGSDGYLQTLKSARALNVLYIALARKFVRVLE